MIVVENGSKLALGRVCGRTPDLGTLTTAPCCPGRDDSELCSSSSSTYWRPSCLLQPASLHCPYRVKSLFHPMARFCNLCERAFPTWRGYMQHNGKYHRHPKPRVPPTTVHYHPELDGMSFSFLEATVMLELYCSSTMRCQRQLPRGCQCSTASTSRHRRLHTIFGTAVIRERRASCRENGRLKG